MESAGKVQIAPERVLVACDDPESCAALRGAIGGGRALEFAPDAEAALRRLAEESFDVLVIGRLESGTMDGQALLEEVNRRWPGQRAFFDGGPTRHGSASGGQATLPESATTFDHFDAKLLQAVAKLVIEGPPLDDERVRAAAVEQMAKMVADSRTERDKWAALATVATARVREATRDSFAEVADFTERVVTLSAGVAHHFGEAAVYADSARAAAERADVPAYRESAGAAKSHHSNAVALAGQVAVLILPNGEEEFLSTEEESE